VPIDFDALLHDATRLLQNGSVHGADEAPDSLRERLLTGFRWLLVDEYQDINAAQYAFLSALAGRTLEDKARKLTLLAVGDDDQNIYEFAGAQAQFIRSFETDYGTKTDYLVENFRSSRHIVDVANLLIAPHPERLKAAHPIVIDSARRNQPPGGDWGRRDAVGAGHVQILPAGANEFEQGWRALQELRRLAALDDGWNWSGTAVIARTWDTLHPVRAACEIAGIPCRFSGRRQKALAPARWREVWQFVEALKARHGALLPATEVRALAASLRGAGPDTPGHALVDAMIDDAYADADAFPRPVGALLEDAFEFLAELGREAGTGLTLTTAHGAKGLEFDHVVVLDGDWDRTAPAERRLYYVAMTRARATLTLCQLGAHGFAAELAREPAVLLRAPPLREPLPDGLSRRFEQLGLKDVDLGFAGRSRSDAVRVAIAKLRAGDALTVVPKGKHWLGCSRPRQVSSSAALPATTACPPDESRARAWPPSVLGGGRTGTTAGKAAPRSIAGSSCCRKSCLSRKSTPLRLRARRSSARKADPPPDAAPPRAPSGAPQSRAVTARPGCRGFP